MADEVTTIPMQQRYATQLAADLKKNLAAQERLRAEERWLRTALESLPDTRYRKALAGLARFALERTS